MEEENVDGSVEIFYFDEMLFLATFLLHLLGFCFLDLRVGRLAMIVEESDKKRSP